jgi:hypothetical protein
MAEKVAALRIFFGVTAETTLPMAIVSMNELWGIVGEGALPVQIDHLVAQTGVMLSSSSMESTQAVSGSSSSMKPPAVDASSMQSPTVGASAPSQSAVSGKKRKQAEVAAPAKRKQQRSILEFGQKELITAEELNKQRDANRRGTDYQPSVIRGHFTVEKCEEQCAPAAVKEFCCPMCPKTFGFEINLTNHMRAHGESVNEKEFFSRRPPPPTPPPLTIELIPTTSFTVKVSILIGGLSREERVSVAHVRTCCDLLAQLSLFERASHVPAGGREGNCAGSTERA